MVSFKLKLGFYIVFAGLLPCSYAEELSEENEFELALDEDEWSLSAGARILQAEIEGPDPVLVLSAAEIKEQGFTNIYEALNSISMATGAVQGDQFSSSPTANAKEVNLRGFGANRTLVLINGRRITDAPTPLDGQENFFNFAAIPLVAVKRIEVVTGGSSAIYGSDAVAGVINIILNDYSEGETATARFGTTTQGGGTSRNLQFASGDQNDTRRWFFGAEFNSENAVYGNQRDWMDDISDNPIPLRRGFPIARVSQFDFNSQRFVLPPGGEATCDALNFDYFELGASVFCGTEDLGFESIQNDREQWSLMFHYDQELPERRHFFADVMYSDTKARARTDMLSTGEVIFINGVAINRTFSPDESGDQDTHFSENYFFGAVGVTGQTDDFDYSLALVGSQGLHEERQLQLKEFETINFFFSPIDRVWQPLDQDQINLITGNSEVDADSYRIGINATLSAELGELNGRALWFSSVFEYSIQAYDLAVDERSVFGGENFSFGWLGYVNTQGKGKREHGALGIETKIPLLDTQEYGNIELHLAGRYDFYQEQSDQSELSGAPTFKLGLSWRPLDRLLVRANYATNFRAPSMHFVYAKPRPQFINVIDELTCRLLLQDQNQDGQIDTPLPPNYSLARNCPGFQYLSVGFVSGSSNLEEERGHSSSLGFVYNPTPEITLTFDAYEINLENIVNRQQDFQTIVEREASCILGEDTEGNPVDTDSPECVNAIDSVTRDQTGGVNVEGAIVRVDSVPEASNFLEARGIDASVTQSFSLDEYGDFDIKLFYSYIDQFTVQLRPGEPATNLRNGELQNNLRSKMKLTSSWYGDKWNSSLTLVRRGSLPNFEKIGRIAPWTTANLTVGYRLEPTAKLHLSIDNVFDQLPPGDYTFGEWPFYNRGQYSGIGREVFLEYQHDF